MAKKETEQKSDEDYPKPIYPLAFGLLILIGILALIARGMGFI